MAQVLKTELHQLLDECNDDTILEEIAGLLKPDSKDWWDELDEKEQQQVLESEEQFKRGEYYSQESLLKEFEQWKSKLSTQ